MRQQIALLFGTLMAFHILHFQSAANSQINIAHYVMMQMGVRRAAPSHRNLWEVP